MKTLSRERCEYCIFGGHTQEVVSECGGCLPADGGQAVADGRQAQGEPGEDSQCRLCCVLSGILLETQTSLPRSMRACEYLCGMCYIGMEENQNMLLVQN